MVQFGTNEWLVDEIYQQYLQDPQSVDRAWWDFFADYRPGDPATLPGPTAGTSPDADAAATARSINAAPMTVVAPHTTPSAPPTPTHTETAGPAATPAPPAHVVPELAHSVPAYEVEAPAGSVGQVAPQPGLTSIPTGGTGPEGRDPAPRVLRGPQARVVVNMESSLEVPTATSVRAMPAKLLIDNRTVINNQLSRGRGGKVSFTHLIGYALVRALSDTPEMNVGFTRVDGKPAVVQHPSVNLGLAIDLTKPDGTRQLLVPCIKGAEQMDFAGFWATYEELVRKARAGSLGADDFAGTTATLTNPGTIGTVSSVPRLMSGQGLIVGVGSMDYPAEWQGAAEETLARQGVSKILTLTSTYDHRIIQGAQSGDFLRRVHQLLLGEHGFYDEIFTSLRIPYEPVRWATDIATSHDSDLNKTARVQELIHAYRVRGHLIADIDPLDYKQRQHPDLDVAVHGLTLWDLDREFAVAGFAGEQFMTLRNVLRVLRDAYCRTVGIEYMHMQDPDQRHWIQDRIEKEPDKPERDEQLRILRTLNSAEAFETFLQTKFVGQKRFSLEGGESVIPLVDAVLSAAAREGMDEVCIGMPHRGRLNVLANIAGKSYSRIFNEFEGNYGVESVQGSGDVKYHLGTEGTFTAEDGAQVKVSLAANPSHLEAVDPVLEGIVRAKQDQKSLERKFAVLPLLMHGDAAFAGQGVVAETLNLSQLQGYRTGGTVHIVVNNQVGFTTSPKYSRSTVYCTDVARMIQAPIFHVNGDDPEAVVRVARMAYEFRQKFAKDVVIDLICYRRRGHNEADDPSLTQPTMYAVIDSKRSVRKLYTEGLIGRGDITVEEAEEALRDFQERLERVFQETRAAVDEEEFTAHSAEVISTGTKELKPQTPAWDVDTSISREVVDLVVRSQTDLPEGFVAHPRLVPQLRRRAEMVATDTIDWGMGEALAIGSLVNEGKWVRLAGQDSRRGTFGHRHAVIVDARSGWQYKPLKQCYNNGGKLFVYDSPLSEYAAMGFEYGYGVARPDALVMWEAQFGDFVNGSQTIIDEFMTSAEQKWAQRSSVVLLLPHGYEGQGPDHSSARIERFLAQCAQDNMTIAQPSTPSSYFHLLRWQVHSWLTRPMVVFTPKSLLRNKASTSLTRDFTEGYFRAVLDDRGITEGRIDPAGITRVLLCSGKVGYDLMAERDKRERSDVAVLRMERLYPLPHRTLVEMLARFGDAETVWVQDEPANMGPWPFMNQHLPTAIERTVRPVTRTQSSSPSVGSLHRHEQEQRDLLDRAFE
ncbi:MAG: multifunctional oxoglutarate decarboxylase/oxoglutarate dehydrogenase thiamine pyrophosphate-binding subunit/dihydrolipoyllysine-residue succinyltransferase subunit [Actinomycetota bacterium]|nr:multifunctional oxoglutarate decarboxylase/oxoglutarate dehydrogenase thiamine pyrophosphate-binding subunit/dihydrolipoyllysine-residue succinyltransferase subunit [Actinomycetota bacterium]